MNATNGNGQRNDLTSVAPDVSLGLAVAGVVVVSAAGLAGIDAPVGPVLGLRVLRSLVGSHKE